MLTETGIERLLWVLLSLLLLAPVVQADYWQGTLKGGGVVNVDPSTHRPTFHYRGGSTQLWDGVHEMDDGSVVIVRDGVAVPDERMLNTWGTRMRYEATRVPPYCEQLMRKVCGFGDECAGSRPCGLARQLRTLAQDEIRQAPYGQISASTLECDKALVNETLFPECQAAMGPGDTPCGRLVKRVCGAKGACAKNSACELAGQLLNMENEERLTADDLNGHTEAGDQCKQAGSNDYFKPCGR